MIRNTQEDELNRREILSPNFITDQLSQTLLSDRIMSLTLHLSSVKTFTSEEERNGIKAILDKIASLKLIKDEETHRNYQMISNLICSFVDYMKLMAPQIEFEEDVIKFYFGVFIKWLENFSADIYDIPLPYQLKFDYILDRLGKTNLLSLMISIGMESEIKKVINTLLKIQGDKRYGEKTANFQNIFLIIKGLLEEVQFLAVSLLNDILMNLQKKKVNIELFMMSVQILTEMKNILSAPINQLIFQMINTDPSSLVKDKKFAEILKISGDEFITFLKTLCKISHEYLINFLSTFPFNDPLKKSNIRGSVNLDIFLAIFSTKHSFYIARDYSQMFTVFLDAFTNKTLKENDKYKVFKCLMKLIYLNNKTEMKKSNVYLIVLEKIKQFFDEVKSEQTGILILNTINEKYFKNKKVPMKIINYSQIFLESKNNKFVQQTILFNFAILKKKIIKTTSLFDLFSIEKKKHLVKISFLFNNLINKYEFFSPMLKMFFNDNLFDLLHSVGEEEVYEKSRIFIILFFLTLNDYKANAMFHKYLMNSLDICCAILKFCTSAKEDTLTKDQTPTSAVNDMTNLQETSLISRQAEQSTKLSKESNVINILEGLGKDEETKMEILQLFLTDNQSLRCKMLEELIEKRGKFSGDDVVVLRKSLIILLENKEIKSVTEFGSLLLNSLDSENESSQGHEFLQTLLSLLFYNVKFNINFILIKEEHTIPSDIVGDQESPLIKYREAFIEIIDFLKKILIAKITSREVINYITVISKLFFDLKDDFLTEKICNLILNELSTFCIENFESSLTYLAILFDQLNKCKLDQTFLFPFNFEFYLFESDKKLSCIKFINELLKLDRKNTAFNDIVFSENFRYYILTEMNQHCETLYKEKINLIKTNSSGKNEVIPIISLRHEILKYEFYLLINEELGANSTNKNNFSKKIFNRLYELCNNEELIEEMSILDNEEENKKIRKSLRQINNIEVCKYINIIFKHFDYGITIKPNHQIKLMNLSLFPELFVRDHLLKKIEKCLNNKKQSIYYTLHAIPILTIFFNDPDKSLKKKANFLFAIFLNYLIKKSAQFKDYEKNKIKNVIYKYLPEVYLSYILMYFVFNSNLNLLFQSKENKYFDSIIVSYLKILKKITSNKFDSNFLIQNCIKIKGISLKGKRVSKKMSHVTYVQGLIKKDNYSIDSNDYEDVKNELCNFMIKTVTQNFTTTFRYEDFKPNAPLIFLSDKDTSMTASHLDKKEDLLESNLQENLNGIEFDLSRIKDFEKKSTDKTYNNISAISKFSGPSQVSNRAVHNQKLQLEPTSKSRSEVEDKHVDFDEFENLPYYNKYKNRRDQDEDEEEDEDVKSKEILLGDLSINKSEFNQHPFSSKNKTFTSEENSIKKSITKEKSVRPKSSNKRKNKDNVENEPKNKKKTKK